MVPQGVALLGLLVHAIVVEGPGDCPAPSVVEERLRPLLAPGHAAADVASLSPGPEGLQISLRRADGAPAGSKTIAGDYSCDELADVAAVMLAAWQSEMAGRELAAPPLVVTAPARATAPAPVRPASPRWELGAGAGASLAGGALAPAALLSAGLTLGDTLGFTLRGLVSGNREVALPGGSGRWRRALVVLGPRLRLSGARARAEAHLGAGLSWLSIAARGFADPRSHDDLVAGLAGGLRGTWTRSGVQPWLEAGAAFWPARSEVFQSPDERAAALPRLELLLAVGASFSL